MALVPRKLPAKALQETLVFPPEIVKALDWRTSKYKTSDDWNNKRIMRIESQLVVDVSSLKYIKKIDLDNCSNIIDVSAM